MSISTRSTYIDSDTTTESIPVDYVYAGGIYGTVPTPTSDLIVVPHYRQQTSFEAVLDQPPSKDHRSMKNFRHYKCWWLPLTMTRVDIRYGQLRDRRFDHGMFTMNNPYMGWSNGWWDDNRGRYRPWTRFSSMYNPSGGDDFVSSPSKLEELWQHGLKSIMPGVKAELSSINSLIELKDFASFPGAIREAGQLLSRLGFKSIRRSGLPLREIVRQAAGNFLQWKFNISPLLSDIAGIKTALTQAEKRMNALVSRCNKVQRGHYRATLSEEALDSTSLSYYGSQPGFLVYNQGRQDSNIYAVYETESRAVSEPSQFHMTISYSFTFTKYQLEHARLLTLLDSLGINLNPQIIWNAIPWSFVVDWLLKVGQYLQQFEHRNMEPQINIHEGCWSILRTRKIVSTLTRRSYDPYWTTDWTQKYPMPDVYETAYRRDARIPTMSSILTSGLSSDEFVLGAALILSRKRHHKS